jgi:Uncharacterised protein family (UPF0160)
MSYKIITHDGKAHMDELLGSALLALHLGELPEKIERINSEDAAKAVSDGEIPDNTYYIDCGLELDSEKKLFDHHQDRDLDSSVLQIFNKYFSHLKETELHNYIKLVSKIDTKGAMSLDDFHLISESRDYFSFGHGVVLNAFEKDPLQILKIFIAGLEDKISFEKLKIEANQWLEEPGNIEIIDVENIKIIKYKKHAPPELVSPIRSVISRIVETKGITAILSFDDKTPDVLTLYRTDYGHNHVDFSKSNPSKTIFKHQGGFLMKFIPSNRDEWIKLIKESLLRHN